jgi:hypothetical protein
MRPHQILAVLPLLMSGLQACSDEGVAPPPPEPELISFSEQIQPIFDARCVACHSPTGQASFLVLVNGQSHANLVGVEATVYPGSQRVVASDPEASVLYNKVANTGTFGGIMPPTGSSLTSTQITLIRTWISEGALDN